MKEFTTTIKEWLIEELGNYIGCEQEFYTDANEFAQKVTEGINCDGSVHCNRNLAIEFICDNFYKFGELLEYYQANFGELQDNPFSQPEKWEVIAYIYGVEQLLNNCDALVEAIDNSEEDHFILTDELIISLINNLNENNSDIEF